MFLYNLNLIQNFSGQNKYINTNIEKLKQNLKNYKGKKINATEEMEKLDEIFKRLIVIEKET